MIGEIHAASMPAPAASLETGDRTPAPSWTKRRMHHLFGRDGRAVIVAMDGARNGPVPGLEQAVEAVARVVAGGVDAILTTFGMARAAADVLGRTGLILALDSEGPIADYGVEQALRFGADAVELKVFPGNPEETKLADLRRLAAQAFAWGMPLLAEPIPVSFRETSAHTLENVARAARIAAEAGADFVKVHYVGPVESYRQVTGSCYVPVLILGGPARPDPREALQMAADALAAGARGVVFGRNVTTHPRPDRMAAALGEIIHGGATVDAAVRSLAAPH
ncbi:MAG: fructose-bisphosphate aldolase [Chloroflexi bacterium]|nr:fructose-bisphosphate aldolase [Chloroflexota bacterium]